MGMKLEDTLGNYLSKEEIAALATALTLEPVFSF
jgi:hypothetical protein